MRFRRLGLQTLALLFCVSAALAGERSLIQGTLPLALPVFPGVDDPLSELVVRGVNAGPSPTTLVLRLDDARSVDYRRRVNEERMAPPGPFELAFPVRGMRRSNGEGFDLAAAVRLFLFATEPGVSAEILLRGGFSLPNGAIGYDLGPDDAPVFPGFAPLGPSDERIIAGRAAGVRRAGAPGLTGTGLVGGTVYRLPMPNGRWRVTLWTEDPGEWETLPHPLNRRIRVNGQDLMNYLWTPEEWVERRYLRLARREPERLDSAWAAFGSLRGGRLDAVASVEDGSVTIELAGDGAASTYLAGILLQPDDGSPSAADAVDAERGRRFDADWPVIDFPPAPRSSSPLLLARGTAARIELQAPAGRRPVALDYLGDLRILAFEGRWTLDRLHTGRNLLRPTAAHLVPLGSTLARNPTQPRRIVLWVTAGKDAVPGPFQGAVTLDDGARIPFAGTVLTPLPPATPMPVGAYLERAPHLDWFSRDPSLGDAQAFCDLQTLARFGLTAAAPPLPIPFGDAGPLYAKHLQALRDLGFKGPIHAYAPLKRLAAEVGLADAPSQLANLAAGLGPSQMAAFAWSVADEPSNAAHGTDLTDLAAALRAATPGFRAAAHLNHPNDLKQLRGIDLALVNPGLSLEPALFAALRDRRIEPWLYNMGNPRLAAGFWGAKAGAAGYLQWHARMPTADPFDPTDGREGDVQFLFPTATVCPSTPDLHDDLLRLAEGVVDARWFAWAKQARPGLAASISAMIPDRWEDANKLTDASLREIRARILHVAQGLR